MAAKSVTIGSFPIISFSAHHDKYTEAIMFAAFVSLALTLADDEHP